MLEFAKRIGYQVCGSHFLIFIINRDHFFQSTVSTSRLLTWYLGLSVKLSNGVIHQYHVPLDHELLSHITDLVLKEKKQAMQQKFNLNLSSDHDLLTDTIAIRLH
jgi:hypothetical protein